MIELALFYHYRIGTRESREGLVQTLPIDTYLSGILIFLSGFPVCTLLLPKCGLFFRGL